MKVIIRNDAPAIKVRNTDLPRVAHRNYSAVLLPALEGTNFGGKGYLMGMLAMTYSKLQNVGARSVIYKSDDIPIVGIRNTD